MQKIVVKPFRLYHLRVWIKTQDLARAYGTVITIEPKLSIGSPSCGTISVLDLPSASMTFVTRYEVFVAPSGDVDSVLVSISNE